MPLSANQREVFIWPISDPVCLPFAQFREQDWKSSGNERSGYCRSIPMSDVDLGHRAFAGQQREVSRSGERPRLHLIVDQGASIWAV